MITIKYDEREKHKNDCREIIFPLLFTHHDEGSASIAAKPRQQKREDETK
jgi:hypothetical protein